MTTTPRWSQPAGSEPVSEILERIKGFHLRVRDQLLQRPTVSDDRLNFARDSICAHEERVIAALEDYVRDGDRAVLDTWVQFVPVEEIQQALSGTDLVTAASVDELLARKAAFDDAVIALYQHMAQETSAPHVVEAFSQLAAQAKKFATQQSWSLRDPERG